MAALSTSWYATIPFWPLLGAVLIGLLIMMRAGKSSAHQPAILGVGVSAVLSIMLFLDLNGQHTAPHGATDTHAALQTSVALVNAPGETAAQHAPAATEEHTGGVTHTIFRWISLGRNGEWIDFNFYFDHLTAVMMIVVNLIGTLIFIYASGYMRDHHGHVERGYERFFAFLALFVFSMCILVLAGNFVVLYMGWELVGLCSYLLIGFYYPKPAAAAAAKKAFIVNRIGDLGFALGIFSLYLFLSPHYKPGENPLDYEVVFRHAAQLAPWQVTTSSLLLLCGALGKSAQFPLYVWLPDAMEGPTPVSALIHAATMVTAGVYMVARCGPLFAHSQLTLDVIMFVGVFGAIFAASMAMAQYDMKRILAYSTMSQLAFMFAGLASGAPDSAVFHLYTHAFFKALLFLTAGSVMHSMGGVIDLRHFSGLRSVMPNTYVQCLVGCLALAGFPLFAGFWSKDEIVHATLERSQFAGTILLITAFMTAYYTFRMFFMCFHGPLRTPPQAGDHPHDSPPSMLAPLWVLAIGAVAAGFAGVTLAPGDGFLGFLRPHGFFHHYVEQSTIVRGAEHAGGGYGLMYLSAGISIAGIGLAWVRYGQAPQTDPDAKLLGPLWQLWHVKYWVDEIYEALFVVPARKLGRIFFATDQYGINGIVFGVARIPRGVGAVLRFSQRGALQGYAVGTITGMVLLLLLWNWLG